MTRINSTTAIGAMVANAGGSCLSNDEPVTVRKAHAAAQTPSSATSASTAPARRGVMRSALLGLAAVMSLCTGPVAQANTPATANMSVTLTIFAACTVSATTLAFPQLAATTQSTVTNQTATVSVTCASGVPYAIGMGQGLNYSTTNRMVYATSNYIAYALYTDSGHSIPWLGVTGTACTTSSDCSVGTGTGSVQTITVYGQVPVLGSAPAVGSYTDTVTLTVDY